MEGLIIFDVQNDIVYKNMCPKMVSKIKQMALSQDLFLPNSDESVDNNIILQLFSPLINSQRIMFCQFDNTYTAIECENDLKFVFAEFLGFIFLRIGSQTVDFLQRNMAISINFAKNFVGPNIGILKIDNEKADSFTDCLESWKELYNLEQGVLLEGVEQLIVNSDLKAIACKALEAAVEKLEQNPRTQNCHGILFVKGKFLGLVSSKQAQKLSSSDVLFISILTKNIQENHIAKSTNTQNNNLLFLQGHKNSASSGCVPHFVHFFLLEKGVILVILIEYGNLQIACSLYDTFFALHKTQHVQMQGDFENLRFSFNKLDSCVKQCFDALKKAKYNNASIESSVQKLNLKWEILKRKYLEFFKTFEKDLNVKIESNTPAFKNEIKELFTLIYMKCKFYEQDFDNVLNISTLVEGKLLEFVEFLSVKAQRNLSIESYLEEFPGLVHFIFVDRFNGIVIAPDLCNMTCLIPKDKVWSMVEYSRSHLKQGHTSVAWKDTALNYSYFLWFEDQSGIFVKPKDTQNNFGSFIVVRPQHEPGILGGDYYQRLYELCFPKSAAKKIKCFELYCIHLGLVTSTCALEHSRRLAATINDVTGALSLELS